MPVVSVLERLWYYLSFTQLSLWHQKKARKSILEISMENLFLLSSSTYSSEKRAQTKSTTPISL